MTWISATVRQLHQFQRKHNFSFIYPEGDVHGANMGPIWGRQDPGGSHVGPMNFAIWDIVMHLQKVLFE